MTEEMKKDSLPVEEEAVETAAVETEAVETKAERPAVLVRDVMEKVFVSVTPDTPIRDVFRLFIKHRLLAVPVVDDDSHLIGSFPVPTSCTAARSRICRVCRLWGPRCIPTAFVSMSKNLKTSSISPARN